MPPTTIPRPVTDLRRRPTERIHQIQQDRVPILLTDRGEPAAVLLDLETYEELHRRLELLDGVLRGEAAHAEGAVLTHAAAGRRLGRWLNPPQRARRAGAPPY